MPNNIPNNLNAPRVPANLNAPRALPLPVNRNAGRAERAAENPFLAANPFLSTSFEAAAAAPLKLWSDWMSASLAMFSPLGYGAMRGPLGY